MIGYHARRNQFIFPNQEYSTRISPAEAHGPSRQLFFQSRLAPEKPKRFYLIFRTG